MGHALSTVNAEVAPSENFGLYVASFVTGTMSAASILPARGQNLVAGTAKS
jgi:hypothetical protein